MRQLTNKVLAMMVAVEMDSRQEMRRQPVVIRHAVAISRRNRIGTVS